TVFCRYCSGFDTSSVVAMDSMRRDNFCCKLGAILAPANAEVPAPVKIMRKPGLRSKGRKNCSITSALLSRKPWADNQASGCCSISLAVQYAPFSFKASSVYPRYELLTSFIIFSNLLLARTGILTQDLFNFMHQYFSWRIVDYTVSYRQVLRWQVLTEQGQRRLLGREIIKQCFHR